MGVAQSNPTGERTSLDFGPFLDAIRAGEVGEGTLREIEAALAQSKRTTKPARNAKRTAYIYYQETSSAYPKTSDLERNFSGFRFAELRGDTRPNAQDLLFYVVNHTARFESTNLHKETFAQAKEHFVRENVFLFAFTPGKSGTANSADYQLTTGERVFTLFYYQGAFDRESNREVFEELKELLH